jgi:hypothetical protein
MKYILTFTFVMVFTLSGFAQQIFSGLSYNMGLTTGDTRDFVKDYSWRGFGFEIRNYKGNNVSFGASLSWNIFDEKTSELIRLEDGAISGTQIRTFNAFPLMLNAHYYVGNNFDAIRPYFGLNVGTYYITQRLEIGILAFEENNWHFGLAPEFGIVFPSYSGSTFFINARYNYAFKAGKSIGGNEGWDFKYWGFNVGVAFSYNAW